ncbi:MAG TPA: hypothetical protein VFV19_11130 [Candidatus Polarisedimenticolaceae bacterium]|nr:hypothetical protein [Candidatus Polarisedimenticolaceae bacterium]
MSFGLFHEGNVAVIGDTSSGDDAAAISVALPVERRTPNSQLRFRYEPTYVAYQNNSDLNYLGQQAHLMYGLTPSKTSSYSFDLDAVRTDHQGVRSTDPQTAVTFVPRTTQTNASAVIRGDHTGRRNLIGWEVRASMDRFSAPNAVGHTTAVSCTVSADCDDGDVCTIDSCVNNVCQHGLDQSNPACHLQDSTGAGASASWRYALTERSSLGLGLDAQVYTFDGLPTAYVESLGVVGAHTFSRTLSMTYIAGAAFAGSGNESDTEPVGDVTLSRATSETTTLSAGARRWVSQGSGIGGASLDQGAYVNYAYSPLHRGANGGVTAGYWKRDPLSISASANAVSTDTLSANLYFGWNFNQYLSLNANYAYSDQTSSQNALNTQFGSYGAYLRWSILGDVRRTSHTKAQGSQQAPQGGERPQP